MVAALSPVSPPPCPGEVRAPLTFFLDSAGGGFKELEGGSSASLQGAQEPWWPRISVAAPTSEGFFPVTPGRSSVFDETRQAL